VEKIWLNSYQLGVPHEINAHAYSSLAHFFEEKCRQFKHRTAFINFETRLSFGELEYQSRFLASYLQNVVKLKPGSRVAVMLPNILQYPIAVFGILRAGMVIVNINVRYKAPELKQELDDSGAQLITTPSSTLSPPYF
jgi:long-chain acyl-CoA synthetase